MALLLYMDVHVPYPVTRGLLAKGIDVITAQMDNTATMEDADLLDRASLLGRIIVTHDVDFLIEAKKRQTTNRFFSGVIFAHQRSTSIGQMISDLELICSTATTAEFENHVEFLPL